MVTPRVFRCSSFSSMPFRSPPKNCVETPGPLGITLSPHFFGRAQAGVSLLSACSLLENVSGKISYKTAPVAHFGTELKVFTLKSNLSD